MNDDRERNRDQWALVEQSRQLCLKVGATIASAKAAVARSKQLREGIAFDDLGRAVDRRQRVNRSFQ